MKALKQFIFCAVTLFSINGCLGQENKTAPPDLELSAQNLKRLFSMKTGYDKDVKAEWIACNLTDSTYYTADTIKLYSDKYFYMVTSCCDFICWTFQNSTAFSMTHTNVCREPPVSSVYPNNYGLKLRFRTKDRLLILSVYKNGKLKDQFDLIVLDYIEPRKEQYMYRLTMVRKKLNK